MIDNEIVEFLGKHAALLEHSRLSEKKCVNRLVNLLEGIEVDLLEVMDADDAPNINDILKRNQVWQNVALLAVMRAAAQMINYDPNHPDWENIAPKVAKDRVNAIIKQLFVDVNVAFQNAEASVCSMLANVDDLPKV